MDYCEKCDGLLINYGTECGDCGWKAFEDKGIQLNHIRNKSKDNKNKYEKYKIYSSEKIEKIKSITCDFCYSKVKVEIQLYSSGYTGKCKKCDEYVLFIPEYLEIDNSLKEINQNNNVNMDFNYVSLENAEEEKITAEFDKRAIDMGKISIITANENDKNIIEAKPGVGKTFTLVERIVYLIEKCNLDEDDIFVLSFSREAVKIIKKRVHEIIDEFDNIRTIDSMVGTIQADIEYEYGDSYNENIKKFVEKLENDDVVLNGILHDNFNDFSHLIVDEAQDLTSFRFIVVQKIMELTNGYTIFFDGAQAIYNSHKGDNFISWLTNNKFPVIKMENENSTSYRYHESNLSKLVDNLRAPLYTNDSYISMINILNSNSEYRIDSIQECIELINNYDEIIVLFRNRMNMYNLMEIFYDNNIYPEIFIRDNNKYIPYRIGLLVVKYEILHGIAKEIKYDFFKNNYEYLNEWDLFASDNIQVKELIKLMENEDILAELTVNNSNRKKMSIIHQVKGREFNNVIQVINKKTIKRGNELEEAKILYVGMSRSKENYHYFMQPSHNFTYSDIWIKWGKGKYKLTLPDEYILDDKYLIEYCTIEEFRNKQKKIINLNKSDILYIHYNGEGEKWLLSISEEVPELIVDINVIGVCNVDFIKNLKKSFSNYHFKNGKPTLNYSKPITIKNIRILKKITNVVDIDYSIRTKYSGLIVSLIIGGSNCIIEVNKTNTGSIKRSWRDDL